MTIFDKMLPDEARLRIPDRETKDEHDRALTYAARPRVANEWEDDSLGVLGLLAPPEWHKRAACRGMGTDLFFPEKQGNTVKSREAKTVCDRCPVRAECLEQGLKEVVGRWGGLSPKDRLALKRARRAA